MKWSFYCFLVVLLFLTGCASKQPRTAPPLLEQNPNEQVSRPFPTDPVFLPPPTDSTPIYDPEAADGRDKNSVIIVVGGTGVASFALIGVLKRLQMERIKISGIVATGWPAIVALGFGFLKSIHDVEWMASRLTEADLKQAGGFDDEKKLLDTARFPKIFETNFGSKEINQSKIPLVIAAVNTDLGKPDTYDRGDWRYPLGKTLSVPGVYRPAIEIDLDDIQAVDMREAMRRSKNILVLNFYDDFWTAVEGSQKKMPETAFMKAYVQRLKKDFSEQAKEASFVGKVTLKKDFDDLANRRLAIVMGYQEGSRLAKEIRAAIKPE